MFQCDDVRYITLVELQLIFMAIGEILHLISDT